MRRREVVAGLGATAAWPLSTRAQPALPRVGFLSGRSAAETVSVLAAFHRGLAEAGFVEAVKGITTSDQYAPAGARQAVAIMLQPVNPAITGRHLLTFARWLAQDDEAGRLKT